MAVTEPAWLEVALNGPWSRQRQPGIPVTADDIVHEALACADEGASIIHFHAYDPVTGKQRDDYDIYAPIINGYARRPMSFAMARCHSPGTWIRRTLSRRRSGTPQWISWCVPD